MSKRLAITVALLLIPALAVGAAPTGPHRADYRELEKVLLAELKETNTPGAAVAIVSGDRVVYARGFGVSNAETGAPVTPEMLFRVGSVTKMLTAAVFVSLAEEMKVALDAPFGDFVKGLGPRLSRTTPRQLLSHTAGVIDYARVCCAQEESGLRTQVLSSKDDDYFFTEPGRIFSYSNPGYILAGYAIEQLTGRPFADEMDGRLFRPLGMTRTTFRPTVAMTFPLSQGHDAAVTGEPAVVRPFVNNVGDWPAGFASSNVFDLARFAVAFMNGGRIDGRKVLSPSVISALSTPYVGVPHSWDIPAGFFDGAQYGHGLFLHEYRGVRVLHHGGIINGFGAFVLMAPEQRFAVILLANRTGSILGKSLEKAIELSLPLKPRPRPSPRTAASMTQPEMESYAGTYVNGLLKIELSVRGGRLYRKDYYPPTAEEGPGRVFEAPVEKVGTNRLAFTPPGEATPSEFIVVPGTDGRPEYLHSFMGAARKVREDR
ncbi:MAG TPA: serine hydrolase domain-containing protein [Pyrinomonadaceae bacterium]|nr:serine hydrolase domain-containing protein [Pyrinomonadaceae bacterium]